MSSKRYIHHVDHCRSELLQEYEQRLKPIFHDLDRILGYTAKLYSEKLNIVLDNFHNICVSLSSEEHENILTHDDVQCLLRPLVKTIKDIIDLALRQNAKQEAVVVQLNQCNQRLKENCKNFSGHHFRSYFEDIFLNNPYILKW